MAEFGGSLIDDSVDAEAAGDEIELEDFQSQPWSAERTQPSETGFLRASIIPEEAAQLVLSEDNIQIACEMRSTSKMLGLDELEVAVNSDGESTLDLPAVEGDDLQIDAASGGQC